MTTTDRAFISAFQRQSPSVAPAATPAKPSAAPGPHFARGRSPAATGRAPLSQVLREVREAQAADAVAPFFPAVELEAFTWPTLAARLATESEVTLLALIDRFARAPEDSIALVGAGSGVGLTTLVLAIGAVASRAGLRTAILDAGPHRTLSGSLGLHRVARLEATTLGADSVAIGSRLDRVTLVVAGQTPGDDATRVAVERLAAVHDLVLVDAGPVADGSQESLHLAAAGVTAAVLVVESGDPAGRRRIAAEGLLAGAAVRPLGVVETLSESGPLGSALAPHDAFDVL
jgi:Mrp family chromosome partitioning ATPase